MLMLTFIVVLIGPLWAAEVDEAELLSRFRPLAMDESWSIVKGPKSLHIPPPMFDNPKSISMDTNKENSTAKLSTVLEPAQPVKGYSSTFDRKIMDVKDGLNVNVSKTIWVLPKTGSPNLTRLITGKDQPTFIADKIIKPSEDDKPGGNVLATYKILVPIFIPALKKTSKVIKPEHEIKYVKETHTEMVPVKKNVARMKTVLKAEPLPKQVITDYVKAEGTSVPSGVDDRLKPNERVLKSVVKNYN